MEEIKTDLCLIGAGSGGLSVAAAAAQMGLDVVLIEKGKMGGDCLNYGCVPSKALLAAAKRAHEMRHLNQFGIENCEPQVDYSQVRDHINSVIAAIAPHDSVERFEGLGVKVIKGAAKFSSSNSLLVNDLAVTAKRFVVATGSSAAVPPIPGLDQVPFFTNETVFQLNQQPQRLIVIGGGPIGCELAQAHLLLGTPVTLLEMFSILPKDDVESVDVVRKQLLANGLDLHENVKVAKVHSDDGVIKVTIEKDGIEHVIEGSHLLIAAGRRPNVDHLNLDKAGIKFSAKGIEVDARLRTSNKRIFAIGDVIGSYQFTHVAGYHAGIVIRNALFRLPAKVSYRAVPWVTYTFPELAHVGINEAQAKQQQLNFRAIRAEFKDIDRSQAEHHTQGFIKVIVSKKGHILGATIVGLEAGELIQPWVLAINNRLKISAIAGMIVPYPTRNDIAKRVAGEFYKPTLYSKKMKRIVKFISRF